MLLQLAAAGEISPVDFERQLWTLSKGHMRQARVYKGGEVRIYRSRAWSIFDCPRCISDLSYPPKHLTPLNRANIEREPLFYGSAGLPPSFVECGLEAGNYVVCSEWRTTLDLVLQEVGLAAESDTSEVEQIYQQIFTSCDSEMYKYSARVARHLLSGDPISGLVYPSVAAQNGSHNLALKTGFVDHGMRFVNAALYIVKNITTPHKYETAEIDFATANPDGSLDWKGRIRRWVLRNQGDQLTMVSTGWSWDAYNVAGVLVDPE